MGKRASRPSREKLSNEPFPADDHFVIPLSHETNMDGDKDKVSRRQTSKRRCAVDYIPKQML